MFKVKWDVQNNGIILSDNITDDEAEDMSLSENLQQDLCICRNYRYSKSIKNIECLRRIYQFAGILMHDIIIKVSLFLREEGQVSIASQK